MSGYFNKIKDKIKDKQSQGSTQQTSYNQQSGYNMQQGNQPPLNYQQQNQSYDYQQQNVQIEGDNNVKKFGADPNGQRDSLQAFQKALDQNNIVQVPSGSYLLNGELFLRGGKQLKGVGPNKPILTKATTGSIILQGEGNVLDNLVIDGRGQMHSGIVISGFRNVINNCQVSFHQAHGICLDGQKSESHHNIISANFITSNKGIGIAQNRSCNNEIVRNDVNNHQQHGITVFGQSHGSIIRDNIINKNGQGNNGQLHIDPGCRDWDIGLVQGFNISDMRVDNTGRQDCFRQFQDALNQHRVVLVPSGTYLLNGNLHFGEGQRLQGVGVGHHKPKLIKNREGTILFQGNNNSIDNFDIDGAHQMASGITIFGGYNHVTNCVIYNHKGHGICLDGQNSQSHNNTINNNISHHNGGVGIAQNKSVQNKISFNVLYENGVEGLTVDNQSHGCIATYNTVYANNNGVGGIGVDMVRDCQINNNKIYDTKLQLAGIKLQNNLGPTDNNQFCANEIYNCRGFAIHLSNNQRRCCSYNAMQGNTIWNCKKGNNGMIQIDGGCKNNVCEPNYYR